MHNTTRTLIWVSIAFGMFTGCNGTGVSQDEQTRLDTEPPTRPMAPQPIDKSEIRFGQARIALGLQKVEVLEQIRLSRAQYDPLLSADSTDLFVKQPSDDAIDSDTWMLVCPTRNSHVLGGGSGIMLEVRFIEGKVFGIKQFPWLAG
jgi:hypothetical protein